MMARQVMNPEKLADGLDRRPARSQPRSRSSRCTRPPLARDRPPPAPGAANLFDEAGATRSPRRPLLHSPFEDSRPSSRPGSADA